ncbi:general secretion pathway protein GspB [Parahaliea aestuarii]|uniref:Type II secretion system protein GspB C-terminal domain-containing protein n=1 Tax=Parahaliea aestuarii TaxID=1852021 RepID=A0A5C8ZSL6_9GAMM|nr:general secretion pathway protein GspB [Parahaliea aestuarii]TXS91518.1 hypothetical protein FVW59_10115 [Parahaliea aestuarii]
MSLILDAINRSQRERANPGEVPGVATVHYAEATVAPSAWKVGALGLALVTALAVIAWLLFRPAEQPPLAPVETVAPAPVAPAQVPAKQEAVAAREPEPAAALEREQTPAAKPLSAAQEQAPVSAEVSALYQQPQAEESVAAPASVEAAPAPKEVQAAEPEEQPLDVGALVAQAEAELRSAELAEHPAPFLHNLSQQRKDAIPTLFYSQHDYRGDGASTVTINSKTAASGQSLGKGVTVVEVLPDSVVLSYDGQEFRLKALNSWVNL